MHDIVSFNITMYNTLCKGRVLFKLHQQDLAIKNAEHHERVSQSDATPFSSFENACCSNHYQANDESSKNVKTEAKSIIGKTISGMIMRPANGALPAIMVLQFSDGSCFEFVSPAARRAVSRQAKALKSKSNVIDAFLSSQLSIFPPDGEAHAHTALPAAAA